MFQSPVQSQTDQLGPLAALIAALAGRQARPAEQLSPLAQAAAGDHPTVGPHTPQIPFRPGAGMGAVTGGQQPQLHTAPGIEALMPLLMQYRQQHQGLRLP